MLRFPQFLTHYKQGSKIQGGDVQQQKKQYILHLQLLKRESPHSQTLQINPGGITTLHKALDGHATESH